MPLHAFLVKPDAHGKDYAEQSSTNEAFLSKILTVCGQFLVRNCSFVAVRKISSVVIDVAKLLWRIGQHAVAKFIMT